MASSVKQVLGSEATLNARFEAFKHLSFLNGVVIPGGGGNAFSQFTVDDDVKAGMIGEYSDLCRDIATASNNQLTWEAVHDELLQMMLEDVKQYANYLPKVSECRRKVGSGALATEGLRNYIKYQHEGIVNMTLAYPDLEALKTMAERAEEDLELQSIHKLLWSNDDYHCLLVKQQTPLSKASKASYQSLLGEDRKEQANGMSYPDNIICLEFPESNDISESLPQGLVLDQVGAEKLYMLAKQYEKLLDNREEGFLGACKKLGITSDIDKRFGLLMHIYDSYYHQKSDELAINLPAITVTPLISMMLAQSMGVFTHHACPNGMDDTWTMQCLLDAANAELDHLLDVEMSEDIESLAKGFCQLLNEDTYAHMFLAMYIRPEGRKLAMENIFGGNGLISKNIPSQIMSHYTDSQQGLLDAMIQYDAFRAQYRNQAACEKLAKELKSIDAKTLYQSEREGLKFSVYYYAAMVENSIKKDSFAGYVDKRLMHQSSLLVSGYKQQISKQELNSFYEKHKTQQVLDEGLLKVLERFVSGGVAKSDPGLISGASVTASQQVMLFKEKVPNFGIFAKQEEAKVLKTFKYITAHQFLARMLGMAPRNIFIDYKHAEPKLYDSQRRAEIVDEALLSELYEPTTMIAKNVVAFMHSHLPNELQGNQQDQELMNVLYQDMAFYIAELGELEGLCNAQGQLLDRQERDTVIQELVDKINNSNEAV